MNLIQPNLYFRYLFILVIGLIFGSNICAQRWERIYQQFPTEGECAFGIESTADGGYLVLGARGYDSQNPQSVYLMKLDADGQAMWTKGIGPGGAVKFARINNGNFAVISRTKHPTQNYLFHYTLCQPNGDVIMTDTINAPNMVDIKVTAVTPIITGLFNGGFAVMMHGTQPGPHRTVFVRTYDESGQPQNAFPIYQIVNQDSLTIRSIYQDTDGFYHGVGYLSYAAQTDADGVWFKMQDNGHIDPSWVKIYDDPNPPADEADVFHDVAPAGNGNDWVLNLRNADLGPFYDTLFLQKVNTNGNLILNKKIALQISNLDFAGLDRSKIVPLPDGGAAILFETYNPNTVGEDFSLARVNSNGDLLWTRHFGREKRFTESPFDLILTADGGFALTGWFNDETFHSNNAYVIKTDADGRINSNYIEGHVWADPNANCTHESNEPSLGGWMVRLEKNGALLFNTLTDENGYYALPTDTGSVKVRIISAANFWQPCAETANVQFTVPFDSTTVNFLVKPLTACPQLEVDIVAPFLRRCFSSTYSVTYANRGTVAANNAQIKVTLDDGLQFQSSNAPWTWAGGQDFTFNVGNLPVGAVGSFQIKCKVSCDAVLGATHCTTAHIYPDQSCSTSPSWSGASIGVDGKCLNNNVEFKVRNNGSANITATVGFIIIEDHIVIRQGHINNLPPGSDSTILVPANGATYRIETDQEPYHPGNSHPSVAVEGCGTDPNGNSSLGYVTIFPEDDGDPFVSIDCQENIGSFDPNDKQGFPRGEADEHYIYPGTDLEYLIRFQNTGTDTAFSVVIRDTLSALLDLQTVRPGPASHPYKMEVLGENILKFTFKDIMLPDSNVNEAASHGFVKFSVQHKPTIPLGSIIYNQAAIFFDFNEPVITNRTWHTVDTGFVVNISLQVPPVFSAIQLMEIAPNPVFERAWINLKGLPKEGLYPELLLRISNANGSIVREQKMANGKCLFERKNLPQGFYFLEILEQGRVMAAGKIVLD